MGRHTDNPIGPDSRSLKRAAAGLRLLDRPSTPAAAYRRRRSRGRMALGLFAIVACMGIALVTVVDPYAGATASPYYQRPAQATKQRVQKFDIDGGYVLVDVQRDTYKIVKPVVKKAPVAAAASGSSSSSSSGGSVGYTTPSGTAQAYAAAQVAERGWAGSEFTCLVDLWNRESGWNTHAENPSGAYGIPQALPGDKMGAGWQDDYRVQIDWGLGYISGRYGSPCGAWAHSNAYGWY